MFSLFPRWLPGRDGAGAGGDQTMADSLGPSLSFERFRTASMAVRVLFGIARYTPTCSRKGFPSPRGYRRAGGGWGMAAQEEGRSTLERDMRGGQTIRFDSFPRFARSE